MVELIEREYEEAREAGRLSEAGAMPLLDSDELLVVSKETLGHVEARLEEVERELCQRKIDEAFERLKAQGITEDMLLSPEDLEDEEASRARRKRRFNGSARAPRWSFPRMFGSLFAKKAKQVA
jgi:hypothetical protein